MPRTAALAAPILLVTCVLCACGGPEVENTPTDVLSRFLDAMDRSAASEAGLEDAYALLDVTAQRALHARAEQASMVAGHDFEPWQMLVQGKFRLRFAPAERGGLRATIDGNSAVVHVVSDDKKSRADVPMVREQGRWRVQLAVPEPHRAVAEPAAVP